MTDQKEISKGTTWFLYSLQMIGWLLVGLFISSVVLAMLACPPWDCGGMGDGDIYFLPFVAFFTALPVGAILILSTRKVKGEKTYGLESVKNTKNVLFVTGLFLVFVFLFIPLRMFLSFLPMYLFLPIVGGLMFLVVFLKEKLMGGK